MFIYVFSDEDKEKLLLNGYKFVCKNKIGDNLAYIFEDNKKLCFEKLDIKAHKTSKLYFG